MKNDIPQLIHIESEVPKIQSNTLNVGETLKGLLFLNWHTNSDGVVYSIKISEVLLNGECSGILSGGPNDSPCHVQIKHLANSRYRVSLVVGNGEVIQYAELESVSRIKADNQGGKPIYGEDYRRPLPKKKYRIKYSDKDMGLTEISQVSNISGTKTIIDDTRALSSTIVNYGQDKIKELGRMSLLKNVHRGTKIRGYVLSDKFKNKLEVKYSVQRISRHGLFLTIVQEGIPEEKKDNRIYLFTAITNINDEYNIARVSIPETDQNVGIIRFEFLPN